MAWTIVLAASCAPRAELAVLGEAPEFSLTERSGSEMGLADLKDSPWIANFIFTNCQGPCPMLSSRMADLQRQTERFAGVRLVSFSVDPEHDTPEVLSEYAMAFGAHPDRWLFLTGSREDIYQTVVKGFKLGLDFGDDPGPSAGVITHTTRFVLIDAAGKIRGYYLGTENDLLENLVSDLESLF